MYKRKKVNFLDIVPKYKKDIKWYKDKNDLVTIVTENKSILLRLFNRPRKTRIHLDKMSSFVWSNICQNKSVYFHALLLKKRFGTAADPLYPRITEYFRRLKADGLITFNVQNKVIS